ncbi:MAG: hypothetical protein IJK44_02455 [Bacteroidales bacterium]|nr:hypothetical protein [Bacteroidales bacterium]
MSKEYDDAKHLMPYIEQVHFGHIKHIIRDLSKLILEKTNEMLEEKISDEDIIENIGGYITGYFVGYIGGGIQIAQRMKWFHHDAAYISKITKIDQKIIMEIEPLEPEDTTE